MQEQLPVDCNRLANELGIDMTQDDAITAAFDA